MTDTSHEQIAVKLEHIAILWELGRYGDRTLRLRAEATSAACREAAALLRFPRVSFADERMMRESKALAVAAMLLTGAVVRIELRKAGKSDPDLWWLGHLDTIAELLRSAPSRHSRDGRDHGPDGDATTPGFFADER